MVRLRKPRSSLPDTTFSTARTWTKRSSGQDEFRQAARERRAVSRSARWPSCRSGLKHLLDMDARAVVESVFRQESGRIVATLIRISGSFDRAEEAMQEAFASALASWPGNGIPSNPGAWITAAAHRKLIDHSRRERTKVEKQ